ncbi:MAG: hypothetical protein IAE99_02140, partial [Rhodothermales bacterium]|nr:hypothetical protein [Rhodothermales bacterium]
FRPAEKDGQPVEVWMTIPVRFRQEKTNLPSEPLATPDRENDAASTFEERLLAAFANTTRSEAECRRLAPAVLDFSSGEMVFRGITDPQKLFTYASCIRSGHPFVVQETLFGEDGPLSEDDAHAAGQRYGERIMQQALARTEAQCAVLPHVTLVLQGEAITFNNTPPSAEQIDYVACAASEHTMWIKGFETGGKSVDEATVNAMINDLFFRVLADYLDLTMPD